MKYDIVDITSDNMYQVYDLKLGAMEHKEIIYVGYKSDRDALINSVLASYKTLCKAVTYEGKVCAVYGVANIDDELGIVCPWTLRDESFKPTIEWWKRSKREVLPQMIKAANGKIMKNWCYHKNYKTIKWLKWMGFEFKTKERLMLEFKYMGGQ